MFVQVELEIILDYLWDLLGAWDWKRNSIPRYESEYQELYNFIQELTKKRKEMKMLGSLRHYRVVSDYFVVLLSVDVHNKITHAAPILSWCISKNFNWFKSYANKKNWTIEELN